MNEILQTEQVETQRKQIYNFLLTGQPITPIEALERFQCFRLAAVVHWLKRNKQALIVTEMIKVKSGKRVAKYHIPHPKLEQAA